MVALLCAGTTALADASVELGDADAAVKLIPDGVIAIGDFSSPERALQTLRSTRRSAVPVPADAGVIWGYLSVQNQTSLREWRLFSTNHLYQSITVYTVSGGRDAVQRQPPFRPALGFSSLLELPLELAPGTRTELLIRMQATMMHAPYVGLQSRASVETLTGRFVLVSLLCVGALFALLIYNGFLAVALRSALYGVYCVYLVAHGAFMLLASGLLLWWLPDLPLAWAQTRPWAVLSCLAMVWFAWQFLGRAAIAPWLRVLLVLQVMTLTALGLLGVLSPASTSATAGLYTAVFMATLASIIVAGALAARRREAAVGIFLAAWSALIASYVYAGVSLSVDAWRTVWTNIAPLLGGTVEMLLLSLALAQSIARARSRAKFLSVESAQKSAFIGTITHEIRTPLHAVLATMEAADLAARNTAAQVPVERGRAACESLYDLVDGLVDHASVSVSPNLDSAPLRLRALVDSVVLLFEARAHAAGVQLDATRVEDVTVTGPVIVLRRVLINLLSNAVKHAGPGTVVVAAAVIDGKTGKQVRLQVVDAGAGMPTDHPALRGQAAGPDLMALYEGNPSSGLGLQLSAALLDAAGGRLTLDSTPGQGTAATVLLPVQQTRAVPAPQAGGGVSAGGELWFADDDAASRAVLQAMSGETFGRAIGYSDGATLLEALENTTALPAAVMVDLHLGADSGLSVLAAIRGHALPGVRQLACVLSSANVDAGASHRAAERLAVVLAKPYDAAALASAVGAAQRQMQAWQALQTMVQRLGGAQARQAANLFVEQAQVDRHRVLEAEDLNRRQSAAHRLVSAAAAMGFSQVAQAARAVERALQQQGPPREFVALQHALDAATAACRALQAGVLVVPSPP